MIDVGLKKTEKRWDLLMASPLNLAESVKTLRLIIECIAMVE
jgi:hypothetical protein